MKIKIVVLFLLTTVTLFAVTKPDTSLIRNIINVEISAIKKSEFDNKFKALDERIENEEKLNEKTLDSISTQLEAATYNLSIFGILFAIAAICIGIYVTYVERKIVRIGDENRKLLQKNEKIKNEVENLNKLIQNDIYGLHLKIKREETLNILDRLNKVPKDIANVCSVLLSRELLPNDFIKVRSSYLKVKASCLNDEGEENGFNRYTEQYKVVLFQHFLNQVMKDDELRKDITNFIYHGIQGAFENDIIKSTTDFTSAIIDLGMHNFTIEISKYFEGLSASSHKNFFEVYNVFFETLQSRKNSFDFFVLIENKDSTRKAKVMYGKLIRDKYMSYNLSETEKLILEELSGLEESEIKAENVKKTETERMRKLEELKKKLDDAPR